MENRVRIALDAMGGDHAPHEIVQGAILAAREYSVEVILVGQEEVVRKELADSVPNNIEIVDAREVVEMDDTALAPLRRKRNSSVRVCANLVAEGKADLYLRDLPTMEWDTAAAQSVVEAAGGEVYSLDGKPLRYGKPEMRNAAIMTVGDTQFDWQRLIS